MHDQPSRLVQLSIPAHSRMLRFARVAAATLAVDLPFTLEDIEDLRVAVDELAAAVIDGLDDSMMLELGFDIQGTDLVIDGRVPGAGSVPELHPVAQELINMVADSYELSEGDGARMFRLVKRGSAET